MDLTNTKAKEIYQNFKEKRKITKIKNPNLKIKTVKIEYIIFFMAVIICNLGTFGILSGITGYIAHAIIVIGAIIEILNQFGEISFEKENIIYKTLLNKKRTVPIDNDTKIYIQYKEFERINRLTGSFEIINSYKLYIEQNNNNKIILDIKAIGSKKIKMLLDNLETESYTNTCEEIKKNKNIKENNKNKKGLLICATISIIAFLLYNIMIKQKVNSINFFMNLFPTVGAIFGIFSTYFLIKLIEEKAKQKGALIKIFMSIAGLLFIVGGILLDFYVIKVIAEDIYIKTNGIETQAVIVYNDYVKPKYYVEGTTTTYNIEYFANGKKYSSYIESTSGKYNKGDIIKIKYMKDNPNNINTNIENGINAIHFVAGIITSIFFIAIGKASIKKYNIFI